VASLSQNCRPVSRDFVVTNSLTTVILSSTGEAHEWHQADALREQIRVPVFTFQKGWQCSAFIETFIENRGF
jgi:hypothetical protein